MRVLALSLVLTLPSAVGPVAQVPPGSVVSWPGEGLESCGRGEESWPPLGGACLYPVDLLHGEGEMALHRTRGGRSETVSIRVGSYPYPVQRLTLPPQKVDLTAEDLARVRRENRDIARLWGRSGKRRFTLPLHPPLDPMPEGGRFGSRRIINGQAKSPHSGADYSAAAGQPVLAAADAEVALVGDHFFAGKSVFLDHGDGLITMYFHMSRIEVTEGQKVRRGDVVGRVGSTGRATGPHLHFGVRWHRSRVDPGMLLSDPGGLPVIR